MDEVMQSSGGVVDKYPRPDWVKDSFRAAKCEIPDCEMKDIAWIPAPNGSYSVGLKCNKCGKHGGCTIKRAL